MKITATDLRTHLYEKLDRVATTGEVFELERKGVRIRIERDMPRSRLSSLVKRPTMLVDPQVIVEQNWTDSWKGDL